MIHHPVLLTYEGEGAFTAGGPHWAKRCDEQFVIGERYRMAEQEDRSVVTHNHYFASISAAWETLPDHLLEQFPTPEMLRKKMLIRVGYADERSFVCSSKAEALRFAAFLKPANEYAVIIAREAVVLEFTAKSQSRRAMGAAEFAKSKQAVLQAIDDLLGVERGTTAKQETAA